MGTLLVVFSSLRGPRYATSDEWATTPLVLARFEQGIDTDTGMMKVGDGETYWPDLPVATTLDGEATSGPTPQPDTDDGVSLVVLAEAAMQ